jgi:hypothetical protein
MFALFIRSADVATDSRLEKYCTALAKRAVQFRIAYWQRSSVGSASDGSNFVFDRAASYGARYANIFNLILWAFFQSRIIYSCRKEIRYIHSVDLDTGLISLFWCRLYSIPFVYDVYDCYSDSRGISGIFKKIIDVVERFVIRRSDISILADVSRYQQLEVSRASKNVIVIENVPTNLTVDQMPASTVASGNLRLCYFGNLEAQNRGLEDVLNFCKSNPSIELHVAGLGALGSLFKTTAEKNSNIHFYGPMKHSDGLALMKGCDAILGLYYLSVENHRYAAPNKYYEHLLLGRPIITSKGTPPGSKVEEFRTGIAIDDGAAALSEAVNWLDQNRTEAAVLGANAKKLWDTRYKSYYRDNIVERYVSQCLKL